jgi:serine/threonine-protein kinase RsbT
MITSTPTKPAEETILPPLHFTVGEPRPAPARAAGASRRDICVEISSTSDIVTARQRGRMLALQLGFPGQDITLIAAAVSEVARNIVDHAEAGEIVFRVAQENGRTGLEIVAHDEGPGIFDAGRIADYGFTASPETGSVGLPGVRLLMDDFQIESTVGRGTTVTMKKWLR